MLPFGSLPEFLHFNKEEETKCGETILRVNINRNFSFFWATRFFFVVVFGCEWTARGIPNNLGGGKAFGRKSNA